MNKFVFAIEDNAGHATYRQNLARFLQGRSDLEATFVPVRLFDYDVWQIAPVIGANLALVASARAASALHAIRSKKGVAAALIHTQSVAHFAIPFMRHTPTIISSDATPANFDGLADGSGHEVRGKRTELFKETWTKATFKAAAMVLGFSNWVKDSYVNDYGVDPARAVVVSSGVDIRLWTPDSSKRDGDGITRILFVGGDLKRKGGDLLLHWAHTTRHRDFELHMVTKHPVPDTPRVIPHYDLTPNAPELVSLAQRCHVFAFPTRADCYPFVCIEAAAAGLATVTFALGAIHEIVVEGETGLLAPAHDDAGFCERLDKLVGDESVQRRMGEAARCRALDRFDAQKNAETIAALMQRIQA